MDGILRTPRLDLVPGSAELLRADLAGPSALSRLLDVDVPASWPPEFYERPTILYILHHLEAAPDPGPWVTYYLVLRARPEEGNPRGVVVGVGGFKSPPDDRGEVEIGYSVTREHHRRGYASEAVRAWIDFAFRDPSVTTVTAQTLPALIPSIGVLEKAGFRFAGEGNDPHAPAGEKVLRYELARAE